MDTEKENDMKTQGRDHYMKTEKCREGGQMATKMEIAVIHL